MVACACVAVVRVARGALGRPVTTMDANANAWRLLGGDDDGARGATCVDRAVDAVEKCARETMDVARRAEGESVEEAVRALAEARARCAADARDVVDAALFLLTAPPHVEVADLLMNPVRPAEEA